MAHLMLSEKYQDCIVIIAQIHNSSRLMSFELLCSSLMYSLSLSMIYKKTIYKFSSYFLCTIP